MFPQPTQDGRPGVPGMHMQPNMNPQMQIQMNQQQASMQQPGMQQPGMQQVGMQQPVMQQGGIQQQGMQQVGMQQPGMQQPVMQQGGIQQPGMQQPVMQQGGIQQPGMQQGGMQQPGMQQGGMQQSGMQPNVSGMSISNVHPGSAQIPRMSSIGQQHSLSGPGMAHQTDMTGGVRPITVGMQHNVKSEPNIQGSNTAGVSMHRLPQSSNQVSQPVKAEGQTTTAQQHDRIIKFKQLLPQLRECLVDLIAIARSNFAANAALDNREKSVNTSSIPRFDKALEQFFSICNMIEGHLSIAYDQLSHALYSMQYTPITVNQMRDGTNPNAFGAYIETVQQQLTFAKEVQNMLLESRDKIHKRHSMLQPRQLPNQTTPKRPQFQ